MGEARKLRYEPNPRHNDPWQRGRRGTLCPRLPDRLPQQLLDGSVLHGRRRYAFHDGRAYCAREHRPGFWHGYPVGWMEVPARLRHDWVRGGSVSRSDVDRYWEGRQ